ncbi:hypothetical protein KVR01_013791 [Diaporthe batatas]|uniref:uncharacterized protein n=1 Tax=Diaporthe batatas TaxID=748121 RepID=UPI001D042F5D|nr:uncharacterized protein KVR01_013791 [Diaporthe batatas]KAG8156339.1 hypothetical protein KVR01_013791 [Diaporthe batatas]
MACRVAGGNNTPEQLWQTILNKTDTSSEMPAWRWEPYERRDARNAAELSKTTRRGYFLDSLESFDAAFFGVSPMEAEQMDPQQRVSLEVAWEALEDAGVDPRSLAGSDTAVFMGVNSDDYSKLVLEDLPNVDAWMGIGTAYCGVPNRISYHLDLMGPSSAAILTGESNVALAGGVNALCGPGLTRVLDKAGATSPEGSCLSFDDDAHGYGRGEGAAVVVLKRLSSAIRDGDNIVAVLKGSAVAQDGKTNGIMAPNAKAQELVARQALRRARIDAATVEYIEAHATSTPLGDPTEVSAISAVYGRGKGGEVRAEPVAIGSVKPNVGHLEAGAGAVGFIKAVTAINRATFPPQANLKKLNSKVDWASSGTRVVREAGTWPEPTGHRRRAAICSYGYGGTVSHAIVEEPEYTYNMATTGADLQQGEELVGPGPRQQRGPVLLVLSAPQERRLAPAASALAAWLLSHEGGKASLSAIANTLALRRAQHNYRATFVVESHEHAAQVLDAFAQGQQQQHEDAISQGAVLGTGVSKGVVWVFSGHGAQWDRMGMELMRSSAGFRDAVQALDPITRAESGFSAVEALETGGFTDRSDRVQVMTYVVQVGLAAVLRRKGLAPSAIIGHSVGEIAASVAAGALTPEEGALIVTRRAELYRTVQGQGAMFMVGRPFEQVQSDLASEESGKNGDVVAAIHSSPSSCVISGKLDATVAYAEKLKKNWAKTMRVATDVAFHHRGLLRPLSGPLRDALQGGSDGIKPRTPLVPLYSTSDAADPRSTALRDAEYWVRNMESPVFLTDAIRAAAADGFRLFLEVSSHPIVSHSVGETLLGCDSVEDEEDTAVVGTMRRSKPAEASIMQAVGALYVKGAAVDFGTALGRRWSPDVPGTQWVQKSFWRKVESSGAPADDVLRATAGLVHDVNKHTLLGLRTPVGGTDTVLYTTRLDKDTKPFPGEHPLHGTEIVPAAVLVNTFHHATGASTLSDITLRVPVAISAPRDIQVVVNDDKVKIASRLRQDQQGGDGGARESTPSRSGGGNQGDTSMSWVTHTTGHWRSSNEGGDEGHKAVIDVEEAKKRINTVLPSNFSTDYLAKVGVSAMGFPWAITEHYGNLKEMLARVDADPSTPNSSNGKADTLPWDAWSWAPLLDAATSVGSTIFFDNPKLRMPAHIEGVDFLDRDRAPPKTAWLHVQEATESNGGPAVHVSVCDDEGRVLVRFRSMRFSEIEGTPGVSGSVESLVHRLAWVPAPLSHKSAGWERAVLLSEDDEVLGLYGKQLGPMLRIPEAGSVTSLQLSPEGGEDATQAQLTSICSDVNSNTAIIYCPGSVSSLACVPAQAEAFISKLLAVTKHVVNNASSASASNKKKTTKIFVVTRGIGSAATTATALAHSPLHGLARIIAAEHPDQWGALVDVEDGDDQFPALAVKYVHGQDVVRVEDQLPRVGRLQPLPRELRYEHQQQQPKDNTPTPARPRTRTLLPRPEGTYLITGGLGALGLEVAGWLVDKGARRVVLVSRRGLPPRSEWAAVLKSGTGMTTAIARIQAMEQAGATVWAMALDMSAPDAQPRLLSGLESLAVPPVLGVVHAAGCVEDQLVMETTAESFSRVLAPKVAGTLALDAAFPAGTLDWLVLFSSCGQLLGFPGQASYASGNAFLDAVAARRRRAGDNAVAVQWTSWRGLGMAAATDFISAELEGKGVTDITVDEAFRAWEHLGSHDIDHGVVLRALPLDEGDPLPAAVLEHIAPRRTTGAGGSGSGSGPDGVDAAGEGGGAGHEQGESTPRPAGGPELKEWLVQRIREVIAGVLMLSGPDEVDPRAATADLGVDSVITVTLRRKLQAALKVKVPPTLTWSHPTANHLATWFMEKLHVSGEPA